MIIEATRIPTSAGYCGLARHCWKEEGNLYVRDVQGNQRDLQTMVRFARNAGRKFAIRHYHVSPGEHCSDEQMFQIVHALAQEFGFDPKSAVVVEHGKERLQLEEGSPSERGPLNEPEPATFHWHVIVPEVHPVTGKVLSSSWMRPRHEKISREFEARLGHQITKGKFNTSVLNQLEAEGKTAEKLTLELAGIQHGPPASARYTSAARRRFERENPDFAAHNRSFNELTGLVGQAWHECRRRIDMEATLEQYGMRMRPGDSDRGTPTLIVEAYSPGNKSWEFLGAMHRLAQCKKKDVAWRLREWEEHDVKHNSKTSSTETRPNKKADLTGTAQTDTAMGADRHAGFTGRSSGTLRPQHRGFQGPDPVARGHTPFSDKLRRADSLAAAARERWSRPCREPTGYSGDVASSSGINRNQDGLNHSTSDGVGWTAEHSNHRQEAVFTDEQRSLARNRLAAAKLRHLAGTLEKRERLSLLKQRWEQNVEQQEESSCSITPVKADRQNRRRAQFRLMLLKRAYGLEGQWLSEDQVQHIRHVDWNAERGWVILSLLDGSRIRDTGTEISLLGRPTSNSVQELVSAVLRRHAADPVTWSEVVLTGSREFRRAAAILLIRNGIDVVNPPLDNNEIALARQLEGLKQPLQVTSRPRLSESLVSDVGDVPSPSY